MGNLLEAAEKGNSKLVKKFIREGVDIQQRDVFGSTPLHKASFEGHVEIVSTLLAEGANPNIQNKKGSTPLHEASRRGYSNVALVLIRNGATIDCQRNVNTILSTQHVTISKDGESPLHRACYSGNPEVASLLISEGANINLVNNVPQFEFVLCKLDQNGDTALHKAVIRHENRPETVSVLINGGANINAQNKDDETPLHKACHHEDLDFVGMLVRAGADIDIQNADKKSPIDIARHKMHPRGVELLEVFVRELDVISKKQALKITALEGQFNVINQAHSQAKSALEQVAEDVGLDATLFQELQLLRRNINMRLRFYQKNELKEEIKRTSDRDTLRTLGEQLRAIPFNEKDMDDALAEEVIKARGAALLSKFETRWGALLAQSDADAYERCRLARDEFELLFREWCQKQSDQLVRQLEELIAHWKDLRPEAQSHQTSKTSTLANIEASFNEMTNLLPDEVKGHYQEVLEKMKQQIPLTTS